MKKYSKNHRNRKRHNWLVYDINDKFLDKFNTEIKGVVYDLGCGEKPYEHMFTNVQKYIGVDWGDTLHELKADIVADLNKKLDIDDCVADTVLSLSVMEHLSEPQIFLNESYRILKYNGKIVLEVPFQWQIHEAPYDFYRYTSYGLEYMFRKAKYKNIKVIPSSGFFSTIVLKMNYFSLRLIRGHYVIKLIIKGILLVIWWLAQKLAPFLDKLDKQWEREAQGFWVIAEK